MMKPAVQVRQFKIGDRLVDVHKLKELTTEITESTESTENKKRISVLFVVSVVS